MRVRGLKIAGIAAIMTMSVVGCMPYSTGPTEVGIRTNKFGLFGTKGVQEDVYQPGSTHFFVPFLTDWHTFDTRLQSIEMSDKQAKNSRGNDGMTFKTIDGNDISLDIIVSYRVDPARAAYVLQNVATNDAELKDSIVRTIARSKPRDLFGELKTEDFYLAEKRSAKSDEVTAVLGKMLSAYGVILEKVDTRDYRFNPEYQQAIEEKKIADQQVEKNRSSAKASEEEYLRKVEEAKGLVAKVKAQADGDFAQAKIKADAYFEQQTRVAEAIMIEGKALAEGRRKMNEALAGGGGETMIRMAIAEALVGKRILLLPIGGGGIDLRTTDINSLLQLYGVQSLANKPAVNDLALPQPQQDDGQSVDETPPSTDSSKPQSLFNPGKNQRQRANP